MKQLHSTHITSSTMSFLLASFLLIIIACFPLQALSSSHEPSFSLDDSAKTFAKAADEIKQQTGYTVEYGKELANYPITGIYQNTSLSLFMRRIFKGKNYTLQLDNAQKKIVVTCFDLLSPGLAKQSKSTTAGSTKKGSTKKGHDSYTGLSYAERMKLKQEQAAAREKAKNDPQHKSAYTGMTRAEIAELRQQQKENVENQKNDQNHVDSYTGLTRAQFEKLQADQKKAREARRKAGTNTSSYLRSQQQN